MPTLKYLDPITGTYKPVSGSPGPSPTPPPPSGVWGTPPLDTDTYGSSSLTGREIYVDSAGKLRAKPDVIAAHLVTDLAPSYPSGTSVMYVPSADAANWPGGGSGRLVVTHNTGNGVISQWCYYWSATSTKAWYRNGTSTGWSPWVRAIDFTDTISGGAASTILVANATNFTLTNSYVLVKNGVAYFTIVGTMKVASSAPGTTGDITNLGLGTMATEYFPAGSTSQQYAATSTGSGRPLNGYVLGGSGTLGIASIGGSAALAIGETVSLAGSYPLL